ncbi:MAG: hypothetical protein ACRC7O_11025 [Fimbriiglobus sp.]
MDDNEDAGRRIFGDRPFSAFQIADRRGSGFFGGRTVVLRDGQSLSLEDAGELQDDDETSTESDGLPVTVRCLLDYPLEVPVLFTIETGNEPWDLWAICCAIADEYTRVYQTPEAYGIWGHDLTDLVIEELLYFPEERLIFPLIGS